MASAQEKLASIRLIRSENIGPRTYFALLTKYGTPEKALAALPELGHKVYLQELAEKQIAVAEKLGMKILLHSDDNYPVRLREIYDPPPLLFYLGNLDLLTKKALGIVGTRNASANGCAVARKLSGDLGKAGVVIISGLARGIDAEAHKAALSSGTIAVVAGGIDVVYPPENKKLWQQIAEQGLLISENPPGAAAIARYFPQRNRIIAGLSHGVLVVEAARKSGSMITASFARREGRPLFAVPGSPLDARAGGTNYLLKTGAILADSAEDIINNLEPIVPQPKLCEEELEFIGEFDEENEDLYERVIAGLSYSPVSIDEIIQQSGASAAMVNALLLELEISGQVNRQSGNKVSLAA